ncbi:hypothetical protein N7G274_010175 [Stereocaulon virgatum]|uniref:Uncharacterized protein n=1 Tax=Stereocaulon virgatum TaxID=373712 RepID=A0ABR3ZUV1_9LECA
MILCNLQTMPIGGHTFVPSTQAQLPPIQELGLKCAFEVAPSTWREALIQGYLPWLWDLDKRAIVLKEAAKPEGHQWNWELLVRHLAQVEIHKPRAVLDDLPMGFRNRRRIWRLVDDILAEKAVGENGPLLSIDRMSSQL